MELPVSFNAVKHHLRYCLLLMREISTRQDLKAFLQRTQRMGHSTLDLYLGDLSPEAIALEIMEVLREKEKTEPPVYRDWLAGSKGYRNETLSDQSEWTLRMHEGKQFIHIHPSRYSPHSIRTQGSTLRTATAVVAWLNVTGSALSLDFVNQVRKMADLPQMKSLKSGYGLMKMIRLIRKYE